MISLTELYEWIDSGLPYVAFLLIVIFFGMFTRTKLEKNMRILKSAASGKDKDLLLINVKLIVPSVKADILHYNSSLEALRWMLSSLVYTSKKGEVDQKDFIESFNRCAQNDVPTMMEFQLIASAKYSMSVLKELNDIFGQDIFISPYMQKLRRISVRFGIIYI